MGALGGAGALLGLGVGGGLNFLRKHLGSSPSQISESRGDIEIKGETSPNQIYVNGRPIFSELLGISSLDDVFDNSRTTLITERESENNIANNLVIVAGFDGIAEKLTGELFNMKSKGAGTGFQLTSDGFVLTAHHNIQKYEEDWRRINRENPPTEANIHSWMEDMKMRYAIVDQEGRAYPIDTSFWATNPAFDIALIKAVTLRKPKSIEFRILADDLKVGDEIKLLGLRDQRPYNQYGKVISSSVDCKDTRPTYDTFLTDAYGVPGFSGGVFMSTHGEFAGLALYIQRNGTVEIGRAGGAKVRNIVQLVRESARELNKLYQ